MHTNILYWLRYIVSVKWGKYVFDILCILRVIFYGLGGNNNGWKIKILVCYWEQVCIYIIIVFVFFIEWYIVTVFIFKFHLVMYDVIYLIVITK